MMTADVVMSRCRQGSGLYGIRIEQRTDGWYATWAFSIDERKTHNEKHGQNTIGGRLQLGDGFPGCPRCGADSFVRCNLCGKLSCWRAGEYWRCQWAPCTSSGMPSGQIESFTSSGDR